MRRKLNQSGALTFDEHDPSSPGFLLSIAIYSPSWRLLSYVLMVAVLLREFARDYHCRPLRFMGVWSESSSLLLSASVVGD